MSDINIVNEVYGLTYNKRKGRGWKYDKFIFILYTTTLTVIVPRHPQPSSDRFHCDVTISVGCDFLKESISSTCKTKRLPFIKYRFSVLTTVFVEDQTGSLDHTRTL